MPKKKAVVETGAADPVAGAKKALAKAERRVKEATADLHRAEKEAARTKKEN